MDIEKAKKVFEKYINGKDTMKETLIKAIEVLLNELDKLEEYKKIAELTKISCCTAQNCEALNNAIKEGLENQKLKVELDKKDKIINEMAIDLEYINKEILDEYDKLPYAESKQKVIDYFTKKVEGK